MHPSQDRLPFEFATADVRNQRNGTRLLLPDEVGQVRFPATVTACAPRACWPFWTGDVVRTKCPTVPLKARLLAE
jgi:hypothetical protein